MNIIQYLVGAENSTFELFQVARAGMPVGSSFDEFYVMPPITRRQTAGKQVRAALRREGPAGGIVGPAGAEPDDIGMSEAEGPLQQVGAEAA